MSDLDISEFGPCACPIRNTPKGPIVPHWRTLVESKYLKHEALGGREVTVTIRSVQLAEVIGTGGKKSKKALVMFQGKEKGVVMGVTCLKAIAGIYGDDTDRWIGQRITIYPTTTEASGETVGTIRVRPTKPAEGGQQRPGSSPPPAAADREPGDDGEDKGDEPSPEEMERG